MKLRACCILFLFFNISFAQNWQTVDNGANNGIHCLYGDTTNNIIYATGFFTSIGGSSANRVAKWDGISWQQIGSGFPNETNSRHAFDIFNGNLVCMNCIYNPFHSNVAQWNGTSWDSIGNNFRDNLFGIRVLNNELYVYGEFLSKNSIFYNSIAKWDGINWISIGFPYRLGVSPAIIRSLAIYNNEIYAGGLFNDSTGGDSNIAKFNGTYWTTIGGGIHGGFDQVTDMEVYQNELYIAGNFKQADGNISNGILRWNGTTMRDVGGGITTNMIYNIIEDIEVFDNKLYAVGHFEEMGGVSAIDIASWDGTDWCGFGNAIDGSVNCLTSMNHELYMATGQTWDLDTVNYIVKSNGIPIADSCGHINVGISEYSSPKYSFSVYPNPASNSITIEFDAKEIKGAFIEIKNLLGQTVYCSKQEIGSRTNGIEIDITSLHKGVYLLSLSGQNFTLNKKLIKS